jgi:hypothetical protein
VTFFQFALSNLNTDFKEELDIFLGFDGVQDTPVEILHVVLLGIVKYLACDMAKNLTKNQKDKLVGRFQSSTLKPWIFHQ